MYQIRKTIFGNVIIRLSDNAFIPFSEDNYVYKNYLKWLAEGNVAEEVSE